MAFTAESPPAQGQYSLRYNSSERVLPWQVTLDQLKFASLYHTHYWYEVGMFKVPVVRDVGDGNSVSDSGSVVYTGSISFTVFSLQFLVRGADALAGTCNSKKKLKQQWHATLID